MPPLGSLGGLLLFPRLDRLGLLGLGRGLLSSFAFFAAATLASAAAFLSALFLLVRLDLLLLRGNLRARQPFGGGSSSLLADSLLPGLLERGSLALAALAASAFSAASFSAMTRAKMSASDSTGMAISSMREPLSSTTSSSTSSWTCATCFVGATLRPGRLILGS